MMAKGRLDFLFGYASFYSPLDSVPFLLLPLTTLRVSLLKKIVLSESVAKSLLTRCCISAGGTWSSYDDCVSPNTSAFLSCADNGNTYIRFSSGNVRKLNGRDYLR